jgi:heme-degrading monooxygenase HmoA
MVFARIAKFYFRKGKREEAFAELDFILNRQARNAKGFRGFLSLLSNENKDTAEILTLWDDEESLVASEKEIFFGAVNKVLNSLEKKPDVEHCRVFSTELYFHRSSKSELDRM